MRLTPAVGQPSILNFFQSSLSPKDNASPTDSNKVQSSASREVDENVKDELKLSTAQQNQKKMDSCQALERNSESNFVRQLRRQQEFKDFLKQNSGQIEDGTWSCYLCGKITSKSGNMRQHFEVYHFSLGGFQCKLCMKTFKTKHSLASHRNR